MTHWISNKKQIISNYESGQLGAKRRKLSTEKFDGVDKADYKCFMNARERNIPVGGHLTKEKALDFAKILGVEKDFKASEGWLERWKKRNNMIFRVIAGQETILSRYELKEIYNADEFGLFYQQLPTKTLSLKGVKSLPCQYESQKKSWMDSEIFTNYIRKLDRKFQLEGRKVPFIIDNCVAHPSVDNLKAMGLIFLPPNTTSKMQPMDQGVIRALKAYYRSKIIKRNIRYIDSYSLIYNNRMYLQEEILLTLFTNLTTQQNAAKNAPDINKAIGAYQVQCQ